MKRKITLTSKWILTLVISGTWFASSAQAPANDDCANATPIACGDTITGSTATATIDTPPECSPGLAITGPGVWFTFVGTGDAITASLCDPTTDYDSKIIIYSGSCAGLVCEGGNDDAGGGCGLQSIAYFNSTLGVNYYILVTGYATSSGNFSLSIGCEAPCAPVPANDDCATAETITLAADTNSCTPTVSTNTCAAISLMNPSCSQFSNCQDVWFTFNSGTNTSVLLDFTEITGSSFIYALYDGCGNANTACAGLNNGFSTLSVTPGTDYWIQIFTDGNTTAGDFSICLIDGPEAPANDDCAVSPVTLVNGTAQTFNGTTFGATTSADEAAIFGEGAVWEAVTLTGACNDLVVDYCGTTPGNMANAYIVYTDCPLTTFTAGTWDVTTCPDSNVTVYLPGLPAGTYYLPVFIGAPNNPGPYVMNVISLDCAGAGIDDIAFDDSFIYPNPASDVLNISADYMEDAVVTIIDELGKTVLTSSLTASIDISALPSGIYIVKLNTADSLKTEKLIIKR